MLSTVLIMLAATGAASVPTATAEVTSTRVTAAGTGRTRTLADVARERRLGIKGVRGGTLSVAGTSRASGTAAQLENLDVQISDTKAAIEATRRQRQALENGRWVDQNIHYNGQIIQDAQRERDAATENCRKTPGCVPIYRPGSQ